MTIPLDDNHNPERGGSSQTTSPMTRETTRERTRETSSQSTGLTAGLTAELTAGLKSELDRDILVFLESNPNGTMNAIAEQLGKARSVVAEHIRNLKAAGLLVREGGRARGVWRVAPHDQSREND